MSDEVGPYGYGACWKKERNGHSAPMFRVHPSKMLYRDRWQKPVLTADEGKAYLVTSDFLVGFCIKSMTYKHCPRRGKEPKASNE